MAIIVQNIHGYFTDRRFLVLGTASTSLPDSIHIYKDMEVEEIEAGISTFEATLSYKKKNSQSQYNTSFVKAGNYFLFQDEEGKAKWYTIMKTKKDRKKKSIWFYAEDAGLDLLNEIVLAYEADKAYPVSHYVSKFTYDSGFELGLNELGDSLTRKLTWEGEATATERLLSVCTQFDHAELSFSFEATRNQITKKYINIHKKRGNVTDIKLSLDRDVDNIVTTESIINLRTALRVTGGTPEGADAKPITLSGYNYDDGTYFVKDGILRNREANQLWTRYLTESGNDEGYITGTFQYDTLSQSELCNRAVAKLKELSKIEQNFEVAISKLPDNIRIGDSVYIVDADDELYLQARVLKLEKSRCQNKAKATLGDYAIKTSNISAKLKIMADEIQRGIKQAEIVASNGTKIYTGTEMPQSPKKDDYWFRANEDGTVDTVKWDGAKWDIVARDLENKEFEKQLNAALQDVADAKAASEEAYDKGLEAIAKGKEATIAAEKADQKAEEVKGQLQDAYEKSEQALSKADEAVAKVDNQAEIVAEAKETAQNAVNKANTAKENADKAVEDATNALAGVSEVQDSLDTEITRMDGELSSKVAQTEYNALKGTVNTQGTLITQNQQAISQKADSKTVDTLTGRVTTAEGKITTMAGQIELKASKSEVDTVKGSVTELDSKLTVESGKIAGLVTKTDGHSTEIANLKLKNNEFSVNLSKVENDFNNLEIGGRNLVIRTGEKNGWIVGMDGEDAPFGGSSLSIKKINVIPKTTLFFTKTQVSGDNYWRYKFIDSNDNLITRVANQSNKFSVIVPSEASWLVVSYPTNSQVKIEKGNKATDWTPAPEDMATATEFSSLNQTVNSLQTTVGNKAEQSQVTQLAGQITSVVSTVNGHTSQITQLGNQIDLKVSKNGVVSSINVSPETVRINAKWIHLSGTSLIDNAVIGTAHLKDASITNAKIANLSADKITSGSIDAGKINVLNLNADNIKSGKISALDIVGSKIVNTFDTTINSARVTGTTTLEKAELRMQYNLPTTGQSGRVIINPLSMGQEIFTSTGKIQSRWEINSGSLTLNDGIHSGTLMAKSLVDNQWWYLGLKSGLSWYGNPDNAYRPRTKLVYIQNKQAMRTSGIITRSSGGGGGNWQAIGTWAASSAGFNLVRDISVIATIQNGMSATISFQQGGGVAVRCPQDWTDLRWDAFVGVED